MSFLSLRGVIKSFGDTAVIRGIDLEVERGEMVCLIGASGSGKSTLLRCINLLEPVDDGEILFDGTDIAEPGLDPRPVRQRIGMVFQSYNLFPHMTAAQNVMLAPRRVRSLSPSALEEPARALFRRFGLEDRMDHYPDALSGGQQQRVALARSLITRPKVLLLDEPLSALDPFLRTRMRAELKRIQKELGITFVHVTHSQEEAMALSDMMVVMNDAKIMQAAPAREVFETPANAFVARFIGGHNVLTSEGREVSVRADACKLGAMPGMRNARGTVTMVEYQGPFVQVSLTSEAGDDLTATMTDREYFADAPQIGDPVSVSWAPGAEHVLDQGAAG